MLSLVEHRGDGKLALHGLSFTVGVLISMTLLAGALIAVKAAGASVGWGFQLQSPWFVALLALLFVTITLNLAGAFEFSGVRISSTGQTSGASLGGSFATGILAVVVASPCTAPFMGAALGYALSSSALESFVVFLCLGLGMSLPWLLLALFPCLTAWLPRPGRWMSIFRTVMAVPMALTALWLFWVLWQQVSISALGVYLLAAALLAIALVLYGRLQFGKATSKGLMAFAFILGAGAYAVAASPLLERAPAEVSAADAWSPAALQAALDEGRPVLIEKTCRGPLRSTTSSSSSPTGRIETPKFLKLWNPSAEPASRFISFTPRTALQKSSPSCSHRTSWSTHSKRFRKARQSRHESSPY